MSYSFDDFFGNPFARDRADAFSKGLVDSLKRLNWRDAYSKALVILVKARGADMGYSAALIASAEEHAKNGAKNGPQPAVRMYTRGELEKIADAIFDGIIAARK